MYVPFGGSDEGMLVAKGVVVRYVANARQRQIRSEWIRDKRRSAAPIPTDDKAPARPLPSVRDGLAR